MSQRHGHSHGHNQRRKRPQQKRKGTGCSCCSKKKPQKNLHLLFPEEQSLLTPDGKVVVNRGGAQAIKGELLSSHWYIDTFPDGRLYLNKMRCKGVAEEQICSKVIQAASMGDAATLRKLLEQHQELVAASGASAASATSNAGDPQSNAKPVSAVIPMTTVVHSRNYLGVTALHICAMDGHLDAARVLLEFSADVNDCNCSCRLTPLHYAAISVRGCSFTMQDWNFEMVNFLLDAGADPGAVGKNGMTPLMCCAQVGNLPGAVRMLKENPRSQLEAHDLKHRTPYLWALQRSVDAQGLQLLLAGVLHSSLDSLLVADGERSQTAQEMALAQLPLGTTGTNSAFGRMMSERARNVEPRMKDEVCYCTKKLDLLKDGKTWMESNASWAVVLLTNYFMPLWMAPLIIIIYLFWGNNVIQSNLAKKGGSVHVPVFVLSHMAISALLVFVHLKPRTGAQAVAYVVLLLVGGIITPHNFFTAATYDHAPSPDELRHRREHAMALMQKGKKPVNFCWQRRVDRCPRSKYCGVIGCVVLRSDHFCVWLDNHVGAGNHKPFVLWLMGQLVHHICFFFLYFGQDPRPATPYPGAPSTLFLDVAWARMHWLVVDRVLTPIQRAWARDPLTGTFGLLYTLFTIYCFFVVGLQLTMIAQNETLNEKRLRQQNKNFFMGSYAQDAAEQARLFYNR